MSLITEEVFNYSSSLLERSLLHLKNIGFEIKEKPDEISCHSCVIKN